MTDSRVSRVATEALVAATSSRQVSRVATEVLVANRPNRQVSRLATEALVSIQPDRRVSRLGVEVLYSRVPSRTIPGDTTVEVDQAQAGATVATARLAGGRVIETETVSHGTVVQGSGRLGAGRAKEDDSVIPGGVTSRPHYVPRWSLYDPRSHERYDFPYNPNKMTTPHSPRNFHIIATAPSGSLTGGSRGGMGRAVELAREPFEWTFSGRIKTQDQYEQLLRWSNKTGRLQLTDHLGRTWSIRPLDFNPNEQIPTPRTPWRYEYDFKVLNYGVVRP